MRYVYVPSIIFIGMIAIVLVYICEIVKMFLAGTRCNAVARVIYITIKFLFLNPMNHVFLLYL